MAGMCSCPGVGDACTRDENAQTDSCNEGDCASGTLGCFDNGRCAEKIAEGQPCTASNWVTSNCAVGFYCTNGTCTNPSPEGGPCMANEASGQCSGTLVCFMGQCVRQ